MKRGSTLFLRGALLLMGACILAICIVALPIGIVEDGTGDYVPILLGLYLPAVPFFFALYQAWKLLGYIDKNTAFSKHSLTALTKIKYCGAFIAGVFTAGMPYIYMVANEEDAPGVIVLGLVIIFASVVIAVFAAVLQRLMKSAMALKSENDLTV